MTDRTDHLLSEIASGDSDLLLVTEPLDVRWLTGFTASGGGVAILGPDTRVFVTNFLYDEQAAAEVDPSFRRVLAAPGPMLRAVPAELPDGDLTLGFQDGSLTVRAHAALRESLPGRVALFAAGDPIETLRAVKDPDEIAAIRAASRVADAALRDVMEQGLVGRTEREVALAIDDGMRRRGASGPSFDTIVAMGAHGALPHAMPRDVTIEPGRLVVIDWGAVLDGYCSDCTRTLATGDVSESDRAVYDLVRHAQQVGLDAIAPGVTGREADAAARAVIEEAGHGERFGHSLGHGVGLEVHEAPGLSSRSDDVLVAGNVVSCEPGVYVPGEVGVRIEDLCVVGEDGLDILTEIPKDLIDVG